ncbi:MAG: toxin-antitoxin system HicB family antitoxin [Synergistaceae bacterium]|nr:toxin-antitoxin system HicB family antitoxin [Synergistaceae bacterium]MBR0222234.1 toxin-antitoxin system HicB family antitoxin [Synergistaceae bacterium]
MAVLSVKLSNSIHSAIKNFAADDGISINQFINSAVIEKIASLNAENYIKERGKLGDKDLFIKILDNVPD